MSPSLLIELAGCVLQGSGVLALVVCVVWLLVELCQGTTGHLLGGALSLAVGGGLFRWVVRRARRASRRQIDLAEGGASWLRKAVTSLPATTQALC